MNAKTKKDLWDFVVDHVKEYDCMPMEFEDANERVWDFDEIVSNLTATQHTKLSKMMRD